MSLLERLAGVTGRSDWKEIDGPDSGHGVDHWFVNGDGEELYVNDDQGHVVIVGGLEGIVE